MDATKLTKTTKPIGTPLYLSPEILKEEPYDQRVDIWAIGCTLYELLTLSPPFNASDLSSLWKSILTTDINPIPTWYSRSIGDLVQSLLVKDIRKRPFIDEVIDLMILRGFKMSDKDKANLQQYRKSKLHFKMRNMNKPSEVFQVLVKRLQKNIMDDSPSNLRFPESTKLEEEVRQERLRNIKGKALNKKVLTRKELGGFKDYCIQESLPKKLLTPQFLSETGSKKNYISYSNSSSPKEDIKLPELSKKQLESSQSLNTGTRLTEFTSMNLEKKCSTSLRDKKKSMKGQVVETILGLDQSNLDKYVKKMTIHDLT